MDLYSDARFWCGIANTDTTTYPLADFTRNANFALDRVSSLIMKWDDTNNTDLPIATTSLVASQQDYGIAVGHLKVLKVRIKDQQGNWVSLDPINRRDLTDSQLYVQRATRRDMTKWVIPFFFILSPLMLLVAD